MNCKAALTVFWRLRPCHLEEKTNEKDCDIDLRDHGRMRR